jgi:2-C-methyl-D-erythritol 4-phosphate cytidylyltransferase/2-C-methyl-D-erythritol 2,4-cyclodiphosphate synthase
MGKPVIRHSVETLLEAGAKPLIVVVAPDGECAATEALNGLESVTLVHGGATRRESVRNGLEVLADDASLSEYVLIHDAARPDLPYSVIEALLGALDEHPGAIPTLPVVDSLALASASGTMEGTAEREKLRRVQTPQAFIYADILKAHRAWDGSQNAGDDAQVLAAMGGSVALVQGNERLKKITFPEDFAHNMTHAPVRIGQGYDVHRLEEGEELWLCGVKLEHTHGLAGHSDADVALHAVTDAILGGIGDGDIGTHFPPSDPQWKGARSGQFLEHAVGLASQQGYIIGNIDLTIICEAPKIGPHRTAMRGEVARLTGLDAKAVSIKATTTEKLGFTGRGEGIAAQAIVSLFALETSS